MSPPSAIILAGPTAVGKSSLALELATRLGGEIISVDSMQVYRGMDVGTAKPNAEEQRQVRHHLIDVLSVSEAFSAAEFARRARRAQAEILARGRVPILCGGTGFYFDALFNDLSEAPPSDPELREQLQKQPLSELLQELQEKDQATFQSIDRDNPRRVVRAIEVIRLSGRPFSSFKKERKLALPGALAIGLERDREDLNRRIDQRVAEMFENGLVEETESLLKQGLADNAVALQALGYRQVASFLQHGGDLRKVQEEVCLKTRQFAKRQMTWFRRQMDLRWFNLSHQGTEDVFP